ncbi:hypothetical protein Hanom_Chr03g00234571 [Helianthus anomalus]
MRAMAFYLEGKKGATFKFNHCRDIEKNSPKWARVPLAGQPSSKRFKSCSSTNRSNARTKFEINLSDDDLKAERPLGIHK